MSLIPHARTLPLMKLLTSLLLLCAILLFESALFSTALVVPADNDPAAAALARFETHYRSAKALSAVFLQQYLENGKVVRKESGKAYFLRPGKMRWDYEAPEKNTFLVDGKYVWFFTPADRTVTRMRAKSSEDWRTPLAFLTTGMKLSRICSRIDPVAGQEPSQPHHQLFRCLLRAPNPSDAADAASNPSDTVLFELSPQGELARISIQQQAGIRIDFAFEDWQWNPLLPKSLFQFAPPPGVVIVDGLLPDTPGLRQ